VQQGEDPVPTLPGASLITRVTDSSDEDKDDNGGGGGLGKRPLAGDGGTDVPESPSAKQKTDGDDVMHEQEARFLPYAGTDYDVDYIVTRLDRLRDW
jgi:hypothetical protein